MNLTDLLTAGTLVHNLAVTGLLLLGVVAFRFLAGRYLGKGDDPSEALRLRWRVTLRNVSLLIFLLGMVIIWAAELRTFALSVVALAAALVLATKELIMCVSGAILRASSGSFLIGHRVEIGSVRGDVIDHSLLSTTILEAGHGHQRTGRTVVLPNSVLLTTPVVNETLTDDYVLHVITVPVDLDPGWQRREEALLQAAREVSIEFLEEARKAMDAVSRRHGLPTFTLEPRVRIQVNSPRQVDLALRIPAPVRERGRLEQQILRRYLELTKERSE